MQRQSDNLSWRPERPAKPVPEAPLVAPLLVDKAAAARLLLCSPRQVEKFMRERGLPYYRIGDRHVRFRVDDLNRWITAQRGNA